MKLILLPIILPIISALVVLATPVAWRRAREAVSILAVALNLICAAVLFKASAVFQMPWLGFGMEFKLRLYQFSGFILLAAAFFAICVCLYSLSFMRQKPAHKQFYSYLLITLGLTNGAVLADNLILMLFFWEGLLLTLFGMIAIGNKSAFKTATKAFIIVGISDLCMMAGIGLTGYLAGTLNISQISLPITRLGGVAFILLMIGAIAKAGAMPFHSWIPDAANDAPLPFMAFLPASLEKLLGIYFLARISLDMFKLNPASGLSILLMAIGCVTILLAVMMALIQKDYKRLLSYHAISQVGYMILGIGTCVPAGIIGGLFHMINHALYKSCLFLTGGSVEKQAGTTNLEKLGGLYSKMPITFICFIVAAASISGVPPFNGFFSKELIYDGALERGMIFYLAALVGSFLTAASFLKLGHAAFLGKRSPENDNVKESSWLMLIPMMTIAGVCVLFGLYNRLPLENLIQPILGPERSESHVFYGLPSNVILIIMTIVVLIAAWINHVIGVKKGGSGLKSVDHIHYSPVFIGVYDRAEKKMFDPYDIGLKLAMYGSRALWKVDRAIDWVYDGLAVKLAHFSSLKARQFQTGYYAVYILWALIATVVVIIVLLK